MIAALGVAFALVSAPVGSKSGLRSHSAPDTGRAVAARAVVAPLTDTAKAPATATKTVAPAPAATDSGPIVAARAVRDTAEVHHLPPRTLPLKRQMMFAGGFMVFIALMMTSLQNFNPND
ncbi:MAG TPA: hypothetical protein PKY05_04760 [Fibrobacteria bacterium]|nr:hypothetical protein [Fibrobacteria bacterium]